MSARIVAPRVSGLKNCVRNSPMYVAGPPGYVRRSRRYCGVKRNSCSSSAQESASGWMARQKMNVASASVAEGRMCAS